MLAVRLPTRSETKATVRDHKLLFAVLAVGVLLRVLLSVWYWPVNGGFLDSTGMLLQEKYGIFRDPLRVPGYPFLLRIVSVVTTDVFVVVPRMLDLKIPAPESEEDTGYRSYSPRLISMQMTGELRDGVSGEVLLRVNMIDDESRYKLNGSSGPNRVTNAREIRDSLERWSRLVREAIDVAKSSKPR